jgi:hypothetical protein
MRLPIRGGSVCTLNRAQIGDEPIDFVSRCSVSLLVIRSFVEELVAPYRHVSWATFRKIRLTIDDPEDLQLRKFSATPLSDACQVRYRDVEEWSDRPATTGIGSVTRSTGHPVYALAGRCQARLVNGVRRLICAGRERCRENDACKSGNPEPFHQSVLHLEPENCLRLA